MVANPGLRQQSGVRTSLRAGGAALLLIGLGCVVGGLVSFLHVVNADPFSDDSITGPRYFWLIFLGMPLMAVGAWMLRAGFLGVASRFVAGETAPVIKDTAAYLTEGRGLLGIGRELPGVERSGPHCSRCGVRNDARAHFCDACGTPLP